MEADRTLAWVVFLVLVIGVFVVDLVVAGGGKKGGPQPMKLKSALGWSALWIGLALCFALGLWARGGSAMALTFSTAYILELSLSVDNLFVFIVIFTHYRVPLAYHRKVLLWGILGALLLRAVFITLGSAAISRWNWLLWVFGAFLIFTSVKLLLNRTEVMEPSRSLIVRVIGRIFKVTPDYVGGRFFVRRAGTFWMTPLFVVLVVIEMTDLVFAVDSIPAVFGITTDSFLIYTSNIFAIMGLRALYFVLEGLLPLFRFLKTGLSAILALIGLKLLFLHPLEARFDFHAGELWMLGVIGLILGASIAASLVFKRPAGKHPGGH